VNEEMLLVAEEPILEYWQLTASPVTPPNLVVGLLPAFTSSNGTIFRFFYGSITTDGFNTVPCIIVEINSTSSFVVWNDVDSSPPEIYGIFENGVGIAGVFIYGYWDSIGDYANPPSTPINVLQAGSVAYFSVSGANITSQITTNYLGVNGIIYSHGTWAAGSGQYFFFGYFDSYALPLSSSATIYNIASIEFPNTSAPPDWMDIGTLTALKLGTNGKIYTSVFVGVVGIDNVIWIGGEFTQCGFSPAASPPSPGTPYLARWVGYNLYDWTTPTNVLSGIVNYIKLSFTTSGFLIASGNCGLSPPGSPGIIFVDGGTFQQYATTIPIASGELVTDPAYPSITNCTLVVAPIAAATAMYDIVLVYSGLGNSVKCYRNNAVYTSQDWTIMGPQVAIRANNEPVSLFALTSGPPNAFVQMSENRYEFIQLTTIPQVAFTIPSPSCFKVNSIVPLQTATLNGNTSQYFIASGINWIVTESLAPGLAFT
jgi:hypothetical protein